MGEIQLFHVIYGGAHELAEHPFQKERGLQDLFETHLHSLTGIDFLASEHSTGQRHKRRIDTLGIDGDGCPVVIEYKRHRDQNIINQGLDYLDWLEDHPAAFRELVRNNLGRERGKGINFKGSWLLCVAGAFPRQDVVAAGNSRRRIGLLRYRRYDEAYITLEWVFGRDATAADEARKAQQREAERKAAETRRHNQAAQTDGQPDFSVYHQWAQVVSNKILHTLFQGLCDYVETLSEEVWVKPSKTGFSAKLKRAGRSNLLYIWPNVRKTMLTVQLRLDPESVPLEEGFTRDISHFDSHGPYGLQIFIRNQDDLERAKPLLKRSYDESG